MSEKFKTVSSGEAIEQLCNQCGLCCNGALFTDVKLQPGDDPKKLAALGLPVQRRGKSICCPQPCPAHDGNLCRVYEDRPKYCRAFECGLLQRVQAGKLDVKTASNSIQEARRQVNAMYALLRQLGQAEENLSLNERYRKVMSEPWDLSGSSKTVRLRSKLMTDMHKLAQIVERDFLN